MCCREIQIQFTRAYGGVGGHIISLQFSPGELALMAEELCRNLPSVMARISTNAICLILAVEDV